MDFPKPGKDSQLWRFGWHMLFPWLYVAAIIVAIIAALSMAMGYEGLSLSFWFATGIFFAAAVLSGFWGMLLLTYENVKSIKENGDRLDSLIEMTNRNRSLLNQIARGVRLSDAAKEVAFRDQDRMELREAVLGKLHQLDFEATYAMIDAMSRRTEYAQLAQELKAHADKYRDATEDNRIRQAAGHVENLMNERQWAAAAAQIDNMLKTFPDSDFVKNLPRRLKELKDERKRQLLAAWDQAVKREDVDESLEILKELDMYLTPNEGLALQESASHVYRTKLHNLGVQFSLAVAEKRWEVAVNTGNEIIRDFPNSRMAYEIRQRMHILQQRSSAKAD